MGFGETTCRLVMIIPLAASTTNPDACSTKKKRYFGVRCASREGTGGVEMWEGVTPDLRGGGSLGIERRDEVHLDRHDCLDTVIEGELPLLPRGGIQDPTGTQFGGHGGPPGRHDDLAGVGKVLRMLLVLKGVNLVLVEVLGAEIGGGRAANHGRQPGRLAPNHFGDQQQQQDARRKEEKKKSSKVRILSRRGMKEDVFLECSMPFHSMPEKNEGKKKKKKWREKRAKTEKKKWPELSAWRNRVFFPS